jgi:uncharacterized membrane protein YjfL (UPF0719 family)
MSMAQLDVFVAGVVYLAAVFVLLVIGKLAYGLVRPGFDVKRELFEKDNFALALSVVGYYLGLVIALGGVLAGEGSTLRDDLIDIGLFGLLAIVLLNVSAFLNDKIILRKFRNRKEIVEDQNAGTGAIEGGHHVANGLIVAGAVSGEEGHLLIALAFWALGQVALVLMAEIYSRASSFDVHGEIEKDNVAVGVAFAGMLIATGNIVRLAITGTFESWARDLTEFGVYFAMAIVLLPLIRFATDLLLVPGVRLNDEMVGQEKPNVGAGVLEAFSYVAGSMLIGWAIF